jgi:hypothetical protein
MVIRLTNFFRLLVVATLTCLPFASPSSTRPLAESAIDDFEFHLLVGSKDELLETIFEEEKSDRLCRFIKSRKLKV